MQMIRAIPPGRKDGKRCQGPFAIFLALAALQSVASAAADRDGWWSPLWEYRLWFNVPAARTGSAGKDIGVVEFHAAGRLREDASDLRVLAGRVPVRHRIIQHRDADDFYRVAFELSGGERRYAVYLGNPAAKDPVEPCEVRRGCLLETFRFSGGFPGDLAGMRDVLRRSEAHPLGADFVPNVFHGHNPFGPQENYVSRYTGWLNCTESGVYTFCTSSDDASFLLVDDALVVKWPGWHGAVADTRFRAKRRLKRGLHKLEYLHVQGSGGAIAVAAWQTPSQKRVLPIPPDGFSPVAWGEFLRIESLGARPAPHFQASIEGEASFAGRCAVRVRFTDRTGEMDRRTVKWDFGDGTTAPGRTVDHIYLRRGVYKVEMTAFGRGPVGRDLQSSGRRGKTASVANRVRVGRPWRRLTTRSPESAEEYARIVRGYDLAGIETASLEPLALLYKSVGAKYAEEQVLREVINRGGRVDNNVYFEAVLFVVRRLREDEEKRAEALSILDAAEKVFRGNANLRARIIRERGDVYLYYEHDLDRALGEYDKVVGRFAEKLEDHIVRITKIRIGDVFRKKGDYDRAKASYRDAERFRIHDIPGDPAVRRGVLIQTAETELARKGYDEAVKALDILEWEFPLEKLRGQASVLRATIEIKRGNTAEALVQFDDLLRVAPRSNSAAEALYLAAGVERLLGRTAEAVRRYERLAKEYPDSPRASDAAKIVGRLREK